MRPEEIKEHINRLKLSEKLLLIEEVWDSIAQENNELPISDWQKKELEKRYSEYKKGNLKLHDCLSVHDEIRNKFT